jgi:hypothetical protein
MDEHWKDILGYENHYKISNFGRVKSLKRHEICGGRVKERDRKERILKPGIDKYGYLKVVLCINGKTKSMSIHRLVLQNFKPNNKSSINHIDGNKKNNFIENLEWCSIAYNNQHSVNNGLAKIGEKHYKAKLNNKEVSEIKQLLQNEKSHTEIAKIFNVNISTIQDIYKKRSWKHHS